MKQRINCISILLLLIFIQICLNKQAKFYSPLSSQISLHGRYYVENGDVKYDWPCFKISFCFANSTKVSWNLEDSWNNYHILIDNKTQKMISPRKNKKIVIFQSANQESHCIDIVKSTQNHYGPLGSRKDSIFKGIQIIQGTLSKQQINYKYRFQFLGDSLTSAFGDLSGTNPTCMFHLRQNQNCLQSWASHLSKKFNADYRIEAISGKGLVKNNFFITGPTMMTKFTEITDNSKKNSYYYQDTFYPDVLFIFIGANDYSNIFPPRSNNFVQGYKDLTMGTLKNIIKDSERKPIIINICQGDFNKELCLNVKAATKDVKYAYQHIYYVQIPQGTLLKQDFGCVGHPNAKGHSKIANSIFQQVRKIIQE